ncbi:MAG: hypothetical protein FWG30_02640 [Eubacteriaceae bacterium]|nr:hypothetical protein [Eubacteriaceae bacterium]
MKAYELIEKLQSEIENASSVPLLSNKIMLEKEDILDLLDDLRTSMPEEIKEAKKVLENEDRIKQTAKRKADSLIEEARQQKQLMIDSNNITKNANEEAEAILKAARNESSKMRAKTMEYINSLINKAQDDLRSVIATLDENKAEVKDKRKAQASAQ